MKNIIKITDLKDLEVEAIKMMVNQTDHRDQDLMIIKMISIQKVITQNLDFKIIIAMIEKIIEANQIMEKEANQIIKIEANQIIKIIDNQDMIIRIKVLVIDNKDLILEID